MTLTPPVFGTASGGRGPSTHVERQRYGVLLLATIGLMAVQGIAPPGPGQRVLATTLAGFCLVLALRAANVGQRWVRSAAALALVAIVLGVLNAAFDTVGGNTTDAMNALLVAIGPPVIALGLVRGLRANGEVRIESVMGVLALYILLGMLFAFVYGSLAHVGGDSFFAGGQTTTASHCIYFSFTTLTTVGYGDFVAHTDLGHTLSIFEALIGQIYLVTIVSLIVSNLRPRRNLPEE